MSRKLIIAINTYDWIPYVAGTILQEKDNFEVLRIFSDQNNSIFWCRNLCSSAIFEQRRFDFNKICKSLGVKKASSLNYNEAIFDESYVKSMITKLRVFIMFNLVSEIYIPNNILLVNIFKELGKLSNSTVYIYGNNCETEEIKKVILEQENYVEKIELRKLMIGINKKEDLDLYKPIERFYSL